MVSIHAMGASGTRCRSFSAAILAACEVSAASDTSCARRQWDPLAPGNRTPQA